MTYVFPYSSDMKKSDPKKRQSSEQPSSSTAAATRQKLEGLPFDTATARKKASDELRYKMWERLENARLFNELAQKPEYQFVLDEFRAGLACNYGDKTSYLVKVFSEGVGVKIDINKDLVNDIPTSKTFVETLIRSMGDTFSKSYYQTKGILPADQVNVADLLKELSKAKGP